MRLRALFAASEDAKNNKNNGLQFLKIAAVAVIPSWQAGSLPGTRSGAGIP